MLVHVLEIWCKTIGPRNQVNYCHIIELNYSGLKLKRKEKRKQKAIFYVTNRFNFQSALRHSVSGKHHVSGADRAGLDKAPKGEHLE